MLSLGRVLTWSSLLFVICYVFLFFLICYFFFKNIIWHLCLKGAWIKMECGCRNPRLFFFSLFQLHQQPSTARRSDLSTCFRFVLTRAAGEACGRFSETPKWLSVFFPTLCLCCVREIIGSEMETTAESVVWFLVRNIRHRLLSTGRKLLFCFKGLKFKTSVRESWVWRWCTSFPPW